MILLWLYTEAVFLLSLFDDSNRHGSMIWLCEMVTWVPSGTLHSHADDGEISQVKDLQHKDTLSRSWHVFQNMIGPSKVAAYLSMIKQDYVTWWDYLTQCLDTITGFKETVNWKIWELKIPVSVNKTSNVHTACGMMVGIMEYHPTANSLQSKLLEVSDVSDGLDETHTRLDGRWNNTWV